MNLPTPAPATFGAALRRCAGPAFARCLHRGRGENGVVWFDIDGRCDLSDAEPPFAGASDEEADALCRMWVALLLRRGDAEPAIVVQYELSLHLERLLAERGKAAFPLLGAILDKTDWRTFSAPHEGLALLRWHPDASAICAQMLDRVPEDFRDGLFTACYFAETPALRSRLLEKFAEWTADPTWSGGATGEWEWLGAFLKKWMPAVPLPRLEPLLRAYFRFL